MSLVKPKLIVFDLDYTLWPFWVDIEIKPPFRKRNNGEVVDADNVVIEYFEEVPQILKKLQQENYKLGIASRINDTKNANKLLKLFDWKKYFQFKEIYPGTKTQHFKKFRKKSGFHYKEMLFFDDNNHNIMDVTKIGVISILVKNGMNFQTLEQGLQEFVKKRSKDNRKKINACTCF